MDKPAIEIFARLSQLLVTFAAALSFAGGGSDGGSCAVKVGGKSVLKDFVVGKTDQRRLQQMSEGEQIQLGRLHMYLRFEDLNGKFGTQDIFALRAFQEAKNRLAKWEADSPEIVSLLKIGIESIDFSGTQIIMRPFANGCKNAGDTPIAVFDGRLSRALLSVPIFNDLSFESQIGVFYKESLRFLQSQLNEQLFTETHKTTSVEAVLSRLVSTLVFGSPTRGHQTLLSIFTDAGYELDLAPLKFAETHSEVIRLCKIAKVNKCPQAHIVNFQTQIDEDIQTVEAMLRSQTRDRKLSEDLYTVYDALLGLNLQAVLDTPHNVLRDYYQIHTEDIFKAVYERPERLKPDEKKAYLKIRNALDDFEKTYGVKQ